MRAYINLVRFLYKLYDRVGEVKLGKQLQDLILSFIGNWFRTTMNLLIQSVSNTQYAEGLGLADVDRFVTTSQWKKLTNVLLEYREKYSRFMFILQQFQLVSIQNLFEQKLAILEKGLSRVSITLADTDGHLIGMDYLLTLIQLARIIIQNGMHPFVGNDTLQQLA